MILKDQSGQGVYFYAYIIATSLPDNSDASNITGTHSLDGASETAFSTINPTFISNGVYWQPLAQAETNGNSYAYSWTSTTSGVNIVPILGQTAQVQLADAVTHGGSTALLALQNISINNPSGDGIDIVSGTGYSGINISGGNVGIYINSIIGLSITSSGNGIEVFSSGNAIDLYATTGVAIYCQATNNDAVLIYAGNNNNGINIFGGQDSGSAVKLTTVNGDGLTISAPDNNAISLISSGVGLSMTDVGNGIVINSSSDSINLHGGGAGIYIASTGGSDAISVNSSTQNALGLYGGGGNSGLNISSGVTGNGLTITSGVDSGNGININSPNGNGIAILGLNSGLSITGTNDYGLVSQGGISGGIFLGSFGLELVGNASGSGLYILSEGSDGVQIYAGSTFTGLNIYGGLTSGDAIKLTSVIGYGINGELSPNALNSIDTAAPAGVAGNFREMLVQTWRKFFSKSVKNVSGLTIKTYADDGTTILTTQTYTDDGTGNESLSDSS